MKTAQELRKIAQCTDEVINNHVKRILNIAWVAAKEGRFRVDVSMKLDNEEFKLVDIKLKRLGYSTGYSANNCDINSVSVSWQV